MSSTNMQCCFSIDYADAVVNVSYIAHDLINAHLHGPWIFLAIIQIFTYNKKTNQLNIS